MNIFCGWVLLSLKQLGGEQIHVKILVNFSIQLFTQIVILIICNKKKMLIKLETKVKYKHFLQSQTICLNTFSLPGKVFSDFAQRLLFLSSVFGRSLIGHFQSQTLSSPRLWNLENIHTNKHSAFLLKCWTVNFMCFFFFNYWGSIKLKYCVYIHKCMKTGISVC